MTELLFAPGGVGEPGSPMRGFLCLLGPWGLPFCNTPTVPERRSFAHLAAEADGAVPATAPTMSEASDSLHCESSRRHGICYKNPSSAP